MVDESPESEDGRERLRANSYPGRGIILGVDASGRYALQVYWITARSAGSKNRILAIEGEDVRTEPFDHGERSADPNIWYRAIGRTGDRHVVSNGVHTDVILDFLARGRGFEDAVLTLTAEDDAPIYTPRIAGLTDLSGGSPSLWFGMAARGSDGRPVHTVYSYGAVSGMGRCFHTYAEDGDPVPVFQGAPYEIDLPGTPEEAAAGIWDLLPPEKRVAMALKVIEIESRRLLTVKVTNALS